MIYFYSYSFHGYYAVSFSTAIGRVFPSSLMRLPITEQPDFLSRVSGRSEATAEALDWLYANVVPALKCVAKSARCCEQDTKKSRIGSARAAEEAQLLKRCSVHSRSRARRRIRKEKKKKMRGWATERKRERRCSQDITL